MEILRIEGTEVWTQDGTRTVDDQSIIQLRLTRTGDSAPASDSVAGLLHTLAGSLPLKTLREGANETLG